MHCARTVPCSTSPSTEVVQYQPPHIEEQVQNSMQIKKWQINPFFAIEFGSLQFNPSAAVAPHKRNATMCRDKKKVSSVLQKVFFILAQVAISDRVKLKN